MNPQGSTHLYIVILTVATCFHIELGCEEDDSMVSTRSVYLPLTLCVGLIILREAIRWEIST